jgi:putative ABC transport system permease protein
VLVVQFLGEAMLQALLALAVAGALVEWTLPVVNVIFNAGAVFNYWSDPGLDAAIVAGTLAIGALAGLYPALILSAFRPAAVLKGIWAGVSGKAWLRQAFVGLQFAALIVFLVCAGVVFAQNNYTTHEAMRVQTDQMLLLRMDVCGEALKNRIAALPGVRGAACSSLRVLPDSTDTTMALPHGGGVMVMVLMVPVDFGFMELYGLKPLAGRLFRAENGDRVPEDPPADQSVHYVINEAAMRQLGFASAQAAVGQALRFPVSKTLKPGDIRSINGTIVGVVKDFSFAPEMYAQMMNLRQIPPTAYSVGPAEFNLRARPSLLHVKLAGRDIPETLAAIDAAWKESGEQEPINRQFLDEYIQNQEQTTLREGQVFAILAGMAMLLACLGLFGVSLSVAARRIKEIGVRKAMGAKNADILWLLLWQFARPALWANLLAWPVAFWAMRQWLSGFAYHVELNLWLFPAAGAAALAVALLTVAGQAFIAARQKPVMALRYE